MLLRPMRPEDAEPLLALFGDPAFMAAFDAPPFDRARMNAWVARNLEHQQSHGYGLFTIVERATDEVIGDCGLEWMELDDGPVAELGYDLRPDRWGQGFATEAAGAVVEHARSVLALPRLISLVRRDNERSASVARRIGMVETRVLRREGTAYRLFEVELGS